MTAAARVPFIDLRPADGNAVQAAIARVIERGWFILGPEVEAFEQEFAAASGTRFAVGTATGTDAIALLLRAADIGPGDEVIVPAVTAAFTALAVTTTGARPVIVDVTDDTLTLDPDLCAAAITHRTRAIVPVHLYGQPAAMPAIVDIAARHHLAIVEDCCQAHLATSGGIAVGTFGIGGAFSFYPTKNLAALGDGGAVVTNDQRIAERVRRLRNGGQTSRYIHVEAGINSRLDEIQAAILRARLPALSGLTQRRRELATQYRQCLIGAIRPVVQRDPGHVYHLFPIRTAARDSVQRWLMRAGIETLIHYPTALSQQPAFALFGGPPCPRAEKAAGELLSLPLHPGLSNADAEHVLAAVREVEKGNVLA